MAGKNGKCVTTDGDPVQRFCWLASDIIPARMDLRLCGWTLSEHDQPGESCIGVFHAAGLDSAGWMGILALIRHDTRKHILVTGVEAADERATLLRIGFGDAVSREINLEELGARARRIAESSQWLPRRREVGPLKLNLLAREAFGFDKPLNLNPREFALLWRLAESAGHPVSKETLIHDVWRMGFVPETNSIAVHMSRLRRKLSFLGLAGMIETSSPGYRLRVHEGHNAAFGNRNGRKIASKRSDRLDRRLQAGAASL